MVFTKKVLQRYLQIVKRRFAQMQLPQSLHLPLWRFTTNNTLTSFLRKYPHIY